LNVDQLQHSQMKINIATVANGDFSLAVLFKLLCMISHPMNIK